jgi:hypothetical protein
VLGVIDHARDVARGDRVNHARYRAHDDTLTRGDWLSANGIGRQPRGHDGNKDRQEASGQHGDQCVASAWSRSGGVHQAFRGGAGLGAAWAPFRSLACGAGTASAPTNACSRSIGTGKMIVLFFSAAISVSVCK